MSSLRIIRPNLGPDLQCAGVAQRDSGNSKQVYMQWWVISTKCFSDTSNVLLQFNLIGKRFHICVLWMCLCCSYVQVYAHNMYTCLWRPVVYAGCLISPHLITDRLLTKPGFTDASWQATWSVYSRLLKLLLLGAGATGNSVPFSHGCWDLNSGPYAGWANTSRLSHLPLPFCIFRRKAKDVRCDQKYITSTL